jgi:2-polyprenyl-3-methyl-5-hydroxy-6-metoxy-1,4-benzoquinol methylase
MMEKELIESHSRNLERFALYRKFGRDIEKERSFIIEKARPVSGNILEAGTGKGYFALALANEGFHFTAFDISAAEQEYAQFNLAYHGLGKHVHFDVADVECLAYEDGFFDVIFAVNMIHHLFSVGAACNELVRILSPSGKIVLSDFNTLGFAIVDKVHAFEGRQHELSSGTMTEAKAILIELWLEVEEHHGETQDVLVASRAT